MKRSLSPLHLTQFLTSRGRRTGRLFNLPTIVPLYHKMAGTKLTRNPSAYAPLPFHLLRLGQFISAAIVTSVVCYFVYFLVHEHYKLPWTFIFVRGFPTPRAHQG